jgi:crotonobetainyl-CoA:carnitine CoA-transferase CaiB-like acyl-CoA transferase
LLPEIERLVGAFTRDEIIARCEKADVPFAPIARPEDLFTDPQLNQGAGLLPTTFPGGVKTKMPRLPIEVGRHDFGIRRDPAAIGADTRDVLRGAGYTDLEIEALLAKGVVFAPGRG